MGAMRLRIHEIKLWILCMCILNLKLYKFNSSQLRVNTYVYALIRQFFEVLDSGAVLKVLWNLVPCRILLFHDVYLADPLAFDGSLAH